MTKKWRNKNGSSYLPPLAVWEGKRVMRAMLSNERKASYIVS